MHGLVPRYAWRCNVNAKSGPAKENAPLLHLCHSSIHQSHHSRITFPCRSTTLTLSLDLLKQRLDLLNSLALPPLLDSTNPQRIPPYSTPSLPFYLALDGIQFNYRQKSTIFRLSLSQAFSRVCEKMLGLSATEAFRQFCIASRKIGLIPLSELNFYCLQSSFASHHLFSGPV